MDYQFHFKRREQKYLLTVKQTEQLMGWIVRFMRPDPWGASTVRSLYFDTPSYQLIRDSISRPVYKEKLRLRSYSAVSGSNTVFLELKKKYQSVVYKRRTALVFDVAMECLLNGRPFPEKNQITDEISYFLKLYTPLAPSVLLSYDRQAYYDRECSEFRLTLDRNIRFELHAASLSTLPSRPFLLPDGKILMEIKSAQGMPLWLADFLCRQGLYKTSYSKYGAIYASEIFSKERNYRYA